MKILNESIMRIYLKLEQESDFENLQKQLPDARVEKIETCCSVAFQSTESCQKAMKKIITLI